MKQMIVKGLMAVSAWAAWPVSIFAQSETPAWLQERMFASGKINTVVLVVSVVLVGIAVWMFALDRRIGKLEKRERK